MKKFEELVEEKPVEMKAPDKVFVHTGQLGFLYASKMNITGNDTAYISKDVLLEWAKGFTEPKIFVTTLIDKLNTL